MSTPTDRRSRKRLATRQAISDVATQLFLERGFDAVTVDEIAAAADVGRMTVFNHFPRKEDMFYDRDEEGREILRATLRQRDPHVAPVETLRLLAHRLVTGRNPVVEFSARSGAFVATAAGSETLRARARAIRDELADVVRVALAESVGRRPEDPDAELAASLLLATWSVAFLQAHRTFRAMREAAAANAAFLAIIDQGTAGLRAALAGTPYAEAAAP
ncbi:TetR/AcrR family transcriptional regulator [Methylobacterium oryzae CBMB20]